MKKVHIYVSPPAAQEEKSWLADNVSINNNIKNMQNNISNY